MKDFSYISIDNNIDINEVINILNIYGIVVINNYTENLEELENDCLLSFKNNSSKYQFGDYVRYENGSYKKHNGINNYFNNEIFKSILDGYVYNSGYSDFNSSVFMTHDYINNIDDIGRNGYLHFDRLRCLKFFTYLTDVTVNDGPFSIVPKSHIKGNDLRKKEFEKYSSYDNLKNRIRIDYPNIYEEIKDDIVPVIGEKGTLIIFDTDLFHKGGQTNKGSRKIVRSHTYLK